MKNRFGLLIALVVGLLILWNLYWFAFDKSFLWARILFIFTFTTCFFAGLLVMKIINPPFPYRINLLLKIVAIICTVPGVCIILRYCGVKVQLIVSVQHSLLLAIVAGVIYGLQQSGCASKKGD